MKVEEAKKLMEQYQAQGYSDEEILAALYGMFQKELIDVEELGALVHSIGYELTEEFLNMSPEDQKTKGIEEVDENEVDKDDIEESKEIGDEDGQGNPDADDNSNVGNQEQNNPNPNENEGKGGNEDKPMSEDEELERAKELYGFKDKKTGEER